MSLSLGISVTNLKAGLARTNLQPPFTTKLSEIASQPIPAGDSYQAQTSCGADVQRATTQRLAAESPKSNVGAVATKQNQNVNNKGEPAIRPGTHLVHTTMNSLEKAYAAFKKEPCAERQTWDLVVPKAPHGGNLIVVAGLEPALADLKARRFTKEFIETLRQTEQFSEEFLKYLLDFNFDGDIDAVQEGRVVSPGIPVMRIKATETELALIQDLIKNRMGVSMTVATKAARVAQAANGAFVDEKLLFHIRSEYGLSEAEVKQIRGVLEFGARRAQGYAADIAARAAVIGGAIKTSNVRAALKNYLVMSGTMAHLFIMLYPPDQEIQAFRDYVEVWPGWSTLLVDTYDTINGVRNAIKVAKEMEAKGQRLVGVRLDSGDMAQLSRQVRTMLDDAGLPYVKIFVSNDLDEYRLTDLLGNGGKFHGAGVGTSQVTGGKEPYLPMDFVASTKERIWRCHEGEGKVKRYYKTPEGKTLPAKYSEEIYELLCPIWRGGQRVFKEEKTWKAHERCERDLACFTAPQKELDGGEEIPVIEVDNPFVFNFKTDVEIKVDLTESEEGSYSCFLDDAGASTGLAKRLKAQGITRVFIHGMAGDYKMGAQAIGAAQEGLEVVVVEDVRGNVNIKEGPLSNLYAEYKRLGIQVISSKEFVDANRLVGVFPAPMLSEPIPHPVPVNDESNTAFKEDAYHLTMAMALFENKKHDTPVTFDYYFRTKPYEDGQSIVGGLKFFLDDLQDFRFTEEEIEYLNERGEHSFTEGFLDYLRNFRFTGTIESLPDGSVVYPNEPIMTIKGTALEVEIIERLVLTRRNFTTLIASHANAKKALSHEETILIEDGMPMAQADAHLEASYHAYIGGTDMTTNLDAHNLYGIPLATKATAGMRLGAELVTGGSRSALPGVYKLARADGEDRIKVSEDAIKTTLPGDKDIVYVLGPDGNVRRRLIIIEGEEIEVEEDEKLVYPRLTVVDGGEILFVSDIEESRERRIQETLIHSGIAMTEVSTALADKQNRLAAEAREVVAQAIGA